MNASKNDSSNSDSSDEDYCPEKVKEDLSEEESDDPCDDASDNETIGQKRLKKIKKAQAKRRKIVNDKSEQKSTENDCSTSEIKLTEEEKKKKADSLWADFLNDTGTKAKPKVNIDSKTDVITQTEKPKPKKQVVTVTNYFDFAGEKVEVTKVVAADSIEARLASSNSNIQNKTSEKKPIPKVLPRKSGMESILGQINKKNKISTLEKSKIDWDGFKKNQGIEEELQNHNRGKNGYLEKQDFLQRADLRQFELEKEMRTAKRSNR